MVVWFGWFVACNCALLGDGLLVFCVFVFGELFITDYYYTI